MRRPYIGITDFTCFEQVEEMLAVLKPYHQMREFRHLLHVGVMMSYKTLHGLQTKWAKAFPAKENIASIFGSDDVYNCLHYADYACNSNLYLRQSLLQAISYGGIGMHAIQLDMIWPDPIQIASALGFSRKKPEIILQIGKNAIEAANNNPQTVVQKLEDYRQVVNRVLLDKSMGRGIGMNAAELEPFVCAIKKHFPDIGIGVAGGLGPETIHLAEPLAAVFPDISIDAQGKLRPSGDALDPIDWNMAKEYLARAAGLFAK